MRSFGQLTCLPLVASTVLLAACGGAGHRISHIGAATGNAIVITAETFASGTTSLIAVLQDHVPGMRVNRSGACPEIILRSRKTIVGDNSPAIYVDGTRALNTCILEMLSPVDVERIEVYRNGLTGIPGYPDHPNGVILIFGRSGHS